MEQLLKVCNRHIGLMERSCDTIGHVLVHVSQKVATTFRDGPAGWTTLEVLAHLRDFDGFFRGRAVMMLEQEYPTLPAYDHEALAIERNYNGQNLQQVCDEFVQSRRQTLDFFNELSAEQWQSSGVHPEQGNFTMLDSVMQVGLHDVTHLEQMTRILTQAQ